MGKLKKAKKSGGVGSKESGKAAAKKAKAAKGEKKSLAKETKSVKKGSKDEEDSYDLIATLEQFRAQWAEEHKVTGVYRYHATVSRVGLTQTRRGCR